VKYTLIVILLITANQDIRSQSTQDWKTSGITTIQGSITNFDKYYAEFNSIEIQVNDWTNAYRRKYFTRIDEKGNFIISFFIFHTQDVLFTYKNKWPPLFVSPNDTLTLIINADFFPDSLKLSGKTAKISNNLTRFLNDEGELISYEDNNRNLELSRTLTLKKYEHWRDSIYSIEVGRLEKYINQNSFDAFFTNWIRNRFKLRYITDLVRYRPIIKVGYSIDSSAIIYQKVVKIADLDPSDYLTLNPSSYTSFINSLHIPLNMLASFAEGEERMARRLSQQSPQEPEKNIPRTNLPSPKELAIAEFPYFIKMANLISNNQIKESVIAHTYTQYLEKQNIDIGIDSVLAHISNSDIKASLINEYHSYYSRILDQNSLKVINEGDTLLNYLTNKYKGYVLYIDFWATWCGVCYYYFQNIPDLLKKLEDKKVAFVFLCCKCNQTKMIQDIKNYNLPGEHIYLTSEQYMFLAKRFNLISVPRYVIIDRAGRIVNENAPGPSLVPQMQGILIKELTKYLTK
jgi:thiol-disulfide isomerase/thioredoxin